LWGRGTAKRWRGLQRDAGRALLLALILALFAAPAFARDVVRYGMQLEPPILDPTSGAASAIDEVATGTIFEGLVRAGPGGTIAPALAESWEIAPDGRLYVFHLRRGVRFQDGSPFDASVVKFSLDRARAPGSLNAQKTYLSVIDRVETPDAYTVRLVLSRPSAVLIHVLTWGDAAMVSPRTAATDATRPVGTGPFALKAWRRGESITLARNPAYWGARPRLAGMEIRFIADPTAAAAAMKAGDLDAFPGFPAPETLAEFQRDPRFSVHVGTTQGKTILALNNARAPFSDLRVRRALAYAIDRKAIIDGAMFGYGQPIGSHFPPGDPDYVDLTGRYPHDVAMARALLAQAGYPHGFDATLRLPPPSYARRSGEIVAAQLAQAGVRVHIETLEWAQWLGRVYGDHDFDMTIVAHTEPMDYGIYARDSYYFGYHSPAYQALMTQADAAVDPAQRHVLLGALQRQIAEDSVNVFLFELPALGVWDRHLQGVAIDQTVQQNGMTGAWFDEPAGPAAAAGAPTADGAKGWGLGLALGVAALLMGLAARALGPAYVARRALALSLTFLAATLVIFLLIQVLPGDPAAYMMGLNANPEAVAALHAQLGLDAPAWRRYLGWLAGMAHGELGLSYTYRTPVAGLIGERLPVSVALTGLATLIALAIALPVGLFAASRRGRLGDGLAMGAAQVGMALPNFWLAMLLVLVFAVGLRWLPSGGFPGWGDGPWPALKALILPALALALPQGAILARVLRSALIETLGQDYVRTARAKGLSPGQVLVGHALRNALIPTLTILGLQLPLLVAGGVIVENVFYLPGLGRLVFQAISQRDLIVVQGVAALLVLIMVCAAFVTDLAYAAADPRLRTRR
ncbi:ABC transporter substrate-binding protein, partial [Caulobacter sp. KR2-114]|uniref:ABC transporter substrate-binding protein n=1 Tax=Caulobacter sp. KR2-114 TaxID=3400912 RepID=UPI003C01EED4